LRLSAADKIKLLIVADSSYLRLAVRRVVADDPGIKVVGEAARGREAVFLAGELSPDVVVMDAELPGGSGPEATREIVLRTPCTVVMLSAPTEGGACATLRALELGAVDFVSKEPSSAGLDRELLDKIRFWHARRPVSPAGGGDASAVSRVGRPQSLRSEGMLELVVLGAGEGGSALLPDMLRRLGPLPCPLVMALRLPKLFTAELARRLASAAGFKVVEGTDGLRLAGGLAVVLPGGSDGTVRLEGGSLQLSVRSAPGVPGHLSVDALFLSAASLSRRTAAVVLTGTGRDGTLGALALRRCGAPVLVQDVAGCLAEGMPAAVIEARAGTEAGSPEKIAARLRAWSQPQPDERRQK